VQALPSRWRPHIAQAESKQLSDYTVIDIETTGGNPFKDRLLCVGIGRKVYPPAEGRAMARMLMSRPGATIVAHSNFDCRFLMLDGAKLAEGVHFHDSKVMAWLLDATQELRLDALAAKYLGHVPPKPIRQVKGRVMFEAKGGLMPIEDVPWEEMEAYNLSDIEVEADLYEYLRGELQAQGLWEHFLEEEAPFSRLLVEMEVAGVSFDCEGAESMLKRAEAKRDSLRRHIIEATGAPDFNPGSGNQVADYLYEEVCCFPVKFDIPRLTGMDADRKLAAVSSIAPAGVRVERVGREYAYGNVVLDGRGLKAPPIDSNKPADSRPTVGAKVLAVMHGDDPWVSKYLEWKKLDKLCGSFLTKWLEQQHDGRLHGRFDQSATVTGRLAAREPNMQQVPTSDEWNVRELFNGELMIGDYAGLEVRLSAHFSHDPLMMEIFTEGKDLYGVLAANAWGGSEDKSNPARGLMKVLMLSSQYGARGEKMSEILAFAGMRGYTARKSNALLKDLEKTLPRLFEWREEVISEARALGYVTTLAGRKRHLPDINSAVWKTMATSERQAVNSKVQGSAADVVRRAMLKARREVRPDEARIILQVHDEILWQRGPEWTDTTFSRLREICETGHGFELDVPLSFDAKVASSWADKGGSGGQVKAGEYGQVQEAMA
jgi:DNA polymerase I-like protein with 3'-5' exonuclease and polymerase domains